MKVMLFPSLAYYLPLLSGIIFIRVYKYAFEHRLLRINLHRLQFYTRWLQDMCQHFIY